MFYKNSLESFLFREKVYSSICLLNIRFTLNWKHVNLQNINAENKCTVFYNDLKSFLPSRFSNSITKSLVENLGSFQFFCENFLIKHRKVQITDTQHILCEIKKMKKVPAKVWILRVIIVQIFKCLLHVKYCSKSLIWIDLCCPHNNLLINIIFSFLR